MAKRTARICATALICPLIAAIVMWARSTHAQAARDYELICAARQNDLKRVASLLDQGASPNAIYYGGEHTAMLDDIRRCLRRLTKRTGAVDEGQTVLLTALSAWWKPEGGTDEPDGNTAIVRLLVDHGAKVNCVDDCGDTPLILACISERTDLVRFLIAHRATVNVKDRYGYSALDYVSGTHQHGYIPAIVDLLKHAGAHQ